VRIIGFSIEKTLSVAENFSGSSEDDRALLGRLTTVVLNWDEPELTIRCVNALVADGVPAERIVVVDNGSVGSSYEQFERELGDCVLVRLPTNVGIARALNIGAQQLPGDNYLVLNNDAFVHSPASVLRLVRAVQRDRVGIAVPRTLNDDLTLQPSVVALVRPASAFVGALGLSRFIPNRWQPRWSTHWDHAESRTIDAASGAVYVVRGEVWHRLGGMTERRWMYGEDIDLCRRTRAAGWRVWFERDATFVHLGSSTVGRLWSDATRAGMIAHSEVSALRAQLSPVPAWVTLFFLVSGTAARYVAFWLARRKSRANLYRAVLRGYLEAITGRDEAAHEGRSEA
jgi:N-acetylglucosaminyl-diphospho-decaprenol L-rhamnosyltransferase